MEFLDSIYTKKRRTYMDLGYIEFRREDGLLRSRNFRRMYFRKRNDVLLYASNEKFERVAGMIGLGKNSKVVEEKELCFRIIAADSKILIFKPKNAVDRLHWLSALKDNTKDLKLNENQEVRRPTLKMLASMAKDVKFEPPLVPPTSTIVSLTSDPIVTNTTLPPPLPSALCVSGTKEPKTSSQEEEEGGGPET